MGKKAVQPSDEMLSAIKACLVPSLRERGFMGSLPHFRKVTGEWVHLVSVLFYQRDHSFQVTVGRGRLDTGGDTCEGIPLSRVDVRCVRDTRRICPVDVRTFSLETLFRYGQKSHGPSDYAAIAQEALDAFVKAGEPWFGRQPEPPQEAPFGGAPWPFRRRHGWFTRHLPWHRPKIRVACVIGSDARPLRHWENWQKIVPTLTALIELLPQPATIRPWHYREGEHSPISFGMLRWNEVNNRRWTTNLNDPSVFMRKTEIWSPSRSSSIQERKYPNFYVTLDGGQIVDEQGFVLAIRLDLLPQLAAAADAVVSEVASLMPSSRVLIVDRTWEERRILGWIRENNLDDAISMDAMEWAEANLHAQVGSFGPKTSALLNELEDDNVPRGS